MKTKTDRLEARLSVWQSGPSAPHKNTRNIIAFAKLAAVATAAILQCEAAALRASADTGTLYSNAADAQVTQLSGSNGVLGQTSSYLNVGAYYSQMQMGLIYMFPIPPSILANNNQLFTNATFSVARGADSPSGYAPTFNADLYGLGYSVSPAVSASDFFVGASDTNSVLIQSSLLTPSLPINTTVSSTSSTLVTYLNNVLIDARANGDTTAYAYFRINPNTFLSKGTYYIMGMSEAGGTAAPSLTYSATSPSRWTTVPLGGGGAVVGLATDPSGNAVYCHTDVGGAFRWQGNQWVSITDNIISGTSANASDLAGITAVAVDPSSPNQIYVAAGMYATSTRHGIFSSNNMGATWTQINSSIVVAGNDIGKLCGSSRMAVDPNNSNILWYGSSQDGLQKGVCTNGTWAWTQIPSTSVPFGQVASGGKYGVSFAACDKNDGNTILYAGVYDTVGSTGGVYSSTDGGTSWSKVSGVSLATPVTGKVAPTGTLYVACNTGSNGAVAKLLRGGTLSSITPVSGIAYIGLAPALSDTTGNTIFASEFTSSGMPYGRVFRSTDGGASWNTQSTNFNNKNYTRTEPDGTPSMVGSWFASTISLLVSATNANELWASNLYGVERTQNAGNIVTSSTTGAQWYTLQRGQEETCVQALKCAPTGAPLLTGYADVNGARYLDTTVRPTGTAGNMLSNPNAASTTGLDFYESDPNLWVRAWDNAGANGGSGSVSLDNGVSWMVFGEMACNNVVGSGTAGWESWDVTSYLAAQKAKGATSVTLVLCSGYSIAPKYSASTISFDSKESGTTTAPQLVINGTTSLIPTADSYVAGSGTSTNYGSATSLTVSYASGGITNSRWTYLKFDLSSVGAITSSTLQLHRQSGSSVTLPIGVFASTNTTWSESTITWATRPALLASTSGDPIADPRYGYCGGRVAISSTNPNCMVWVTEGTTNVPRYSTDRGVTWAASTGAPNSQIVNRFSPSALIQPLASDRVNGKFYYMKLGAVSGGHHSIYSSTDGGATWVLTGTCPTATYNVYRAQIVTAPAANDVWVCDDGVSNIALGGVWHSTDGGTTWTKMSGITAVRQVAFGKAQNTGYSVFINGYKNGAQGIYRSDDYGATWTLLDIAPTVNAIDVLAADRQTYGKVYFGTSGRGVFQGQ